LSSNREKPDEPEHRGGRNYFRATAIPSDRLLRMKVKLWRVDLLSGILRLGAGDRRGEEQV
jgi:hypothetical protein